MNELLQWIVCWLIGFAAAAYLWRQYFGSQRSRRGGCGGCKGCQASMALQEFLARPAEIPKPK